MNEECDASLPAESPGMKSGIERFPGRRLQGEDKRGTKEWMWVEILGFQFHYFKLIC